MGRQEKRALRKKIIGLILVPALIAAILLSVTESKSEKGKNPGAAGGAGQSAAEESGVNQNDSLHDGTKASDQNGAQAGAQNNADAEDLNNAEAADSENDGEMGDLSEENPAGAGNEGAQAETIVVEYDPVQEISFSEGTTGGFKLQRSVPVQIDAAILGGEQGTRCWSVFLPAEIADHPRIVFSKYKTVTLQPLGGGERLGTGRLGSKADSAVEQETKTRDYSSGDEVTGLTNGSAFRVHMTSEDGTRQTTDLYVFSCKGTASMYLDTKSGSMEKVDSDKTKETSEDAQFAVFRADGTLDSAGDCSVRGRGNSTWTMNKRPYNVNLEKKQRVLGMSECKKLCLLANTFDPTNLLDRISSQIALAQGMRDTPEGEFVNLYLNGKYNGLYFLSQRPRTGGSVNIKKLDDKILEANGLLTEDEEDALTGADATAEGSDDSSGTGQGNSNKKTKIRIPKRIALHVTGSKLNRWAYNWPREPENNTGGYLLQQYSRYQGDGGWFSTNHRRFRIMSPSYPTMGQANYIAEYMLSAERAIYSEDGTDPESGKHYEEFLDLSSWQDMFLLEEYFAEWDAERWSFYVIKDRDDPLLYCGPMWDFDHSAGLMIYGNYPETAVSMLLFRDTRHGWLYKLLSHDEFVRDLHTRWTERFSPCIHDYLDNKIEQEIAAIESAAYMNNIRRANDYDYREKTDTLVKWLRRRLAFLDDYTGTEDGKPNSPKYCRVLFEFPWGSLSHYVIRGQSLDYLPLAGYGETQVKSQIQKNEIVGWQDENGKEISADIVIGKDRTFTPIYRQ